MIVQGVVKPAPGLDFASKPDVRLGVKLGPEAMSARCPVCPKADTTGRFYEYTPELDAARRSRALSRAGSTAPPARRRRQPCWRRCRDRRAPVLAPSDRRAPWRPPLRRQSPAWGLGRACP